MSDELPQAWPATETNIFRYLHTRYPEWVLHENMPDGKGNFKDTLSKERRLIQLRKAGLIKVAYQLTKAGLEVYRRDL